MMKTVKILFFIIILSSSLFSRETLIKRKLICLYNSIRSEDSVFNNIHERLEVVLNHYGYYCDYYNINELPETTDDYYGIVYWSSSNVVKNPLKFYNWLNLNKKNKKILLIGDIPVKSPKKDYFQQVNKMLQRKFGFCFHGFWYNNPEHIKITKKSEIYDFEINANPITLEDFNDIRVVNSAFKPLITLEYQDNDLRLISQPVFMATWGAFALGNKIFYTNKKENIKRWIINPFKFIEKIFDTEYPVPDTTTINGKRILYIHIDGDGVNSLSEVEPGKICGEVWYKKIGKKFSMFKTGVSFIAGDLDPKYAGSKRTQKIAKKIFSLRNVEPASHTYTHPLSWKKALVVYEKKGEEEVAGIYEHIKALKAKGGEVNHVFEIIGSLKYINKFTPKNKKANVLYWSGDCMPTVKDLRLIKKNRILAFNGGDTFFDFSHNSYSYVTPIGRDVNGLKQIYSSDSNENVYTELWTANFWGFSGVTETFKRTGFPIRIKPVNLYYHFYSVEKIAAYKALLKVYNYLQKNRNDFYNVFPSQFIQIAKNFYNVKIYKTGENSFKIKNAYFIKEFRLRGNVKIRKTANIKSVIYNKKLNVTYVTLGEKNIGEFIKIIGKNN